MREPVGVEISSIIWMGFEPKAFRPAFQSTNYYAKAVSRIPTFSTVTLLVVFTTDSWMDTLRNLHSSDEMVFAIFTVD